MHNVQLRVSDLLYAAFKRWKMILALGLLGFFCGFVLSGISYLQGNYTSYEIDCSIAITSQSSTGNFINNSDYLSSSDFYLAQDMVDAATFVIKSNRALQTAIDNAGLVSVTTKDVSQNLEVSRYNETQVLLLTLSWNNADAGIRLMNALLDASKEILPQTLMVGSVAVIDAPEAKYMMLVTTTRSAQLVTCLRLSVTILFSIWLVENLSLHRIIKLFSFAQVLLNLAIIGIIVLRPGLAFQSGDTFSHALRGVYEAKNAMASELAFGLVILSLYVIDEAKEKNRFSAFWLVAMALQIILLLMAKATGALLISVMIALYHFVFGKLQDLRLPLGWIYVICSVGFLIFAFTILPLFAPLLESMGKDATLTGRTELWNGIYRFMQQHNMLTGFGYGQFWNGQANVRKLHLMYNRKSYFSRMSTGAHNQIMELWLNIGLLGIASYFLAIIGSMRFVKYMKQDEYMKLSSIFFYLTLCGLTERIFENAYAYRVVMFFILLAVACSWLPDRKLLRRRKTYEQEPIDNGDRTDL